MSYKDSARLPLGEMEKKEVLMGKQSTHKIWLLKTALLLGFKQPMYSIVFRLTEKRDCHSWFPQGNWFGNTGKSQNGTVRYRMKWWILLMNKSKRNKWSLSKHHNHFHLSYIKYIYHACPNSKCIGTSGHWWRVQAVSWLDRSRLPDTSFTATAGTLHPCHILFYSCQYLTKAFKENLGNNLNSLKFSNRAEVVLN